MQTALKFLCGAVLATGIAAALPSVAHGQVAQKNTALLEARKKIAEQQKTVTDLKAEQQRMKDKRRTEFETKEEWKNTATKFKKAKAANDAAKKAALASVQAKPEYKAAAKNRDALQAKLQELQKPGGDPEAVTKVGTQLAAVGISIKKMETEASEHDDKALEAKDAFDTADKEMKELDQEVEAGLASDPDYAALQQQIEQGELQLAQMKEQLNQQQKSELAAKSAASKAASASRKTSRPPTRAPKGSRGGGAGGY